MCSGLAKYDRNKQFYVVCLRLLAFMKLESDIGYKKKFGSCAAEWCQSAQLLDSFTKIFQPFWAATPLLTLLTEHLLVVVVCKRFFLPGTQLKSRVPSRWSNRGEIWRSNFSLRFVVARRSWTLPTAWLAASASPPKVSTSITPAVSVPSRESRTRVRITNEPLKSP